MTPSGRLLLTLGFAFAVSTAHAGELQAGRDFRLLETPKVMSGKTRIEVTEFFWYGCPHCFDLEPIINRWTRALPDDVHFRRVPALFNPKWVSGARLYYTLEALNLVVPLHEKVFAAIHEGHLRLLDDEAVLFEWMERHGVERQKFTAAWNAPGLQARVLEAQRLTQESGIGGVPALIVNGRYQALTDGSYGNLLQRVDQLIARARRESVSGN